MILKLKIWMGKLNNDISKKDIFENALILIEADYSMASIEIKHEYYSVPIAIWNISILKI